MTEATNILFSVAGISVTLSDLASFATTVGLIVAISQLILDRRVRKENAKRNSIKEAVNIAKLFQERLLVSIGFISNVYDETGFSEYVDKNIPRDKPLRFTREEVSQFTGERCEDIIKRFRDKETLEMLGKAAYNSPQFVFEDQKNINDNSKKKETDITFRNKHIQYVEARSKILNTLEWAAMLFNTGVADDNVIYQSLHNVFIRCVHQNYFYIAVYNGDDTACEQLYYNVIVLYNRWVEKCEKMKLVDTKRICRMQKQTERLEQRGRSERSRAIVKGPRM